MKSVITIVGSLAYGLLVVYLCVMFAGGLFSMIYWFFVDPSKLAQFAFNCAVGLIGLIGLFYRKENNNIIDKSS